MKNILISGGNFVNKGAEAMLYVSVNECINRYPGCVCVLQLAQGFFAVRSLEELNDLSANYKRCNMQKGKSGKLGKLLAMISAYHKADMMIDVSGYELSSKLGNYPSLRYLFKIALAKWMHTKVVLMPQSFGPFDYSGKLGKLILFLIKKYMKYPAVCFAREKESADYLSRLVPKAHVELSSDMVLQNQSISKALEKFLQDTASEIKDNSVGLVVNRRLYEQYGKECILPKYVEILEQLLGYGREVYLLCHAGDDLDICEELKQSFADKDKVHVISKVLSCFEFQKLAKDFDYVVAARYHSIVHSYKEAVPCVALGWAVKYRELLELMEQKQYLINIGKDDYDSISNVIGQMEAACGLETETIRRQLEIVQQQNCFDMMESIIECQR